MENTVTISKEEYDTLLKAQKEAKENAYYKDMAVIGNSLKNKNGLYYEKYQYALGFMDYMKQKTPDIYDMMQEDYKEYRIAVGLDEDRI